MKKPKGLTKAELQRKVFELESQLAHVYHFADATIHKAGFNTMKGSGVIVQLTTLGGSQIILPVMIKDGLSDESILALRMDIERSYQRAVELKPRKA